MRSHGCFDHAWLVGRKLECSVYTGECMRADSFVYRRFVFAKVIYHTLASFGPNCFFLHCAKSFHSVHRDIAYTTGNGGRFRFNIDSGTDHTQALWEGTHPGQGTWHHYCGVYDKVSLPLSGPRACTGMVDILL
jgi:hypothetical protein